MKICFWIFVWENISLYVYFIFEWQFLFMGIFIWQLFTFHCYLLWYFSHFNLQDLFSGFFWLFRVSSFALNKSLFSWFVFKVLAIPFLLSFTLSNLGCNVCQYIFKGVCHIVICLSLWISCSFSFSYLGIFAFISLEKLFAPLCFRVLISNFKLHFLKYTNSAWPNVLSGCFSIYF